MTNNDKALEAKRKELLECGEAEAALQNPQIVAYFEQARATAVDAMLNPAFEADEKLLWRVRSTAQTVDRLFKYLNEKRDMRAFIEDEIKALEGNSHE